jgi:hypothetical protein
VSASESFYRDLPAFEDFVEVTNPANYRAAPADWSVVITDVIGSTKAIEAGRYKDVNALGVASIVALRNALSTIELPYVFGGDGATLLVPDSRRATVEATLRGIRELARTSFELDMRASLVSIAELAEAGHEVLVARYRASPDVCFAMFSGSGLSEAERRVKDPEQGSRYAVSEDGPASADFTGFECRWQPIPARLGQVASILIQARAEDRSSAAQTYRSILAEIETILEGDGRPVDGPRLQLQGLGGNFDAEAKIRSGRGSGLGFRARRLVAKAESTVGRTLMKRGWSALGFPGDVYKGQVVANTDFRKFDDTLRMVVDVDAAKLEAIQALLAGAHARGELVYGVHAAGASLMTCAIQEYHGDHVHFVDGADGGYALAAKQLKAQLKT